MEVERADGCADGAGAGVGGEPEARLVVPLEFEEVISSAEGCELDCAVAFGDAG